MSDSTPTASGRSSSDGASSDRASSDSVRADSSSADGAQAGGSPSESGDAAGRATLNVDIWLDVACPWCAVGERRFAKVADSLPFGDDVAVRFHSFQLDPNAPERATMSQAEYLAGRGMDPEQFGAVQQKLEQLGAELDFHFDQESTVPSNTHTSHRLIQAAAEHGVQAEVVQGLFSAFFENGQDVGDPQVLEQIAISAGMPREAARAVLDDPQAYRDRVGSDISEATRLGIHSVPFFVLDEKYGIAGAQSEEVFEQALTQVHDEVVAAAAER